MYNRCAQNAFIKRCCVFGTEFLTDDILFKRNSFSNTSSTHNYACSRKPKKCRFSIVNLNVYALKNLL